MDKKIIYCCGDSHTAGGELADDLLWPEQHPGFLSEDEIPLRDMREIQRWNAFRDRSLRLGEPVGWSAWQEHERRYAWPARLETHGTAHVINAARIGSSTEWITRQVISDVSALLRDHAAAEITVMVQPSTAMRMQMHDRAQGWTSFQMADAYGMDGHVHRWFNDNETDLSLVTRWLIAMIGMLSWLRSTGVDVLLIDSGQLKHTRLLARDPSLQDLATSYERLAKDCWFSQGMDTVAQDVHKSRCPDLHWTREVHDRFAEALAQRLT